MRGLGWGRGGTLGVDERGVGSAVGLLDVRSGVVSWSSVLVSGGVGSRCCCG